MFASRSLGLGLGAPPQQEFIAHPTFLSVCVLQHHGGHRATLSALVSSSHDFRFHPHQNFKNKKDETNINIFIPVSSYSPVFYRASVSPPLLDGHSHYPTTTFHHTLHISNNHTTSPHSPATSAQQTHQTPHPHTSFPYIDPPDYTYPLVPVTHTFVDQFCSLYTFHQIQLPKHHTPLPLPIRNPQFPHHTSRT